MSLYEAPKLEPVKAGRLTKGLWALGFVLAALALVLFALAFLLRGGSEEKRVEVATRSILQEITSKYEIVTKSAFVDQETEIVYDEGSTVSNWLWGKTITARGVVQVDVGVDLSDLKENDVQVDEKAKTVTIQVPKAQVVSAVKFGRVDIETDQGILQFALANDAEGDFNLALDKLLEEASLAVESDPVIFREAREESVRVLRLIVEGLGYQLVVPDLTDET